MSWTLRHEDRAADYRASGAWYGRTIVEDAYRRAERHPSRPAFIEPRGTTTMETLLREAEALADSFGRLGLGAGDVISFMLPNWTEGAVINLAAAMAGCIVNPIVPIYRERETRFILADCASRLIFIPQRFRGFDYPAMIRSLREDLPRLDHVILVRGTADGALCYADLVADKGTAPGRGAAGRARVDPDAVKMIMYTSGTTGNPKGVIHNHQTLARAAMATDVHWNIEEGDHVLMASPVTHVTGYSTGLERPLLSGTTTVLMEQWDAEAAVGLIDAHGVAMTVSATPFLAELVAAAARLGSDLPTLRAFACGGASVPSELVREANRRFRRAPAFRVYGSTEAPFVTLGFDAGRFPELAATTDGKPVDYECRIADARDAPLPPTQDGEVQVRGPALFLGYTDHEATKESLTADGYFRTGDIGHLTEEGALVITDRKKDLIIRGGENISPREIEELLHRMPEVKEAAVVAMPHARLGETACAFLVLRDGAEPPDIPRLSAFLRKAGLATQKFPEAVRLLEDLPRTQSGKIRKDELRRRIRAEMAG